MSLPEIVQQLFVRHHLRIVLHLDYLRMAGCSGAHLIVGWIFCSAAGKVASERFDAGDHLINSLSTPATAAAERGGLKFIRSAHSCSLGHGLGSGETQGEGK